MAFMETTTLVDPVHVDSRSWNRYAVAKALHLLRDQPQVHEIMQRMWADYQDHMKDETILFTLAELTGLMLS